MHKNIDKSLTFYGTADYTEQDFKNAAIRGTPALDDVILVNLFCTTLNFS